MVVLTLGCVSAFCLLTGNLILGLVFVAMTIGVHNIQKSVFGDGK